MNKRIEEMIKGCTDPDGNIIPEALAFNVVFEIYQMVKPTYDELLNPEVSPWGEAGNEALKVRAKRIKDRFDIMD
jgi:hypothetical protein